MARKNEQNDDDEGLTLPHVPGKGLGFDLRLRSLTSSRQSLARLLREHSRGTVPPALYRDLVWGMSQFLGYLKESQAQDLETRLSALETALNGKIPTGGRR